jgi:hypothetical protein
MKEPVNLMLARFLRSASTTCSQSLMVNQGGMVALNQLIAVLIVVDNHGSFVTCISLEKITPP